MPWVVRFHPLFDGEIQALSEAVQDALLKRAGLLERFGPALGRPAVDTLGGSKHKNMKELRFDADDGVWRVAFAFDPKRQGVLLVAGDKSGTAQKEFYRRLIERADTRYDDHLVRLKEEEAKSRKEKDRKQ
ncbi:MAG: type II toxin-antitoxin system RelE/ParE family toxin [Micropepsaceae bacterium]